MINISSRVYVLNEDTLVKIGQRKFTSFYNRTSALPKFKGQIIKVVTVTVELKNKKPIGIINRQYSKYKLNDAGMIEDGYLDNFVDLVSAKLSKPKAKNIGGVVDASKLFQERALENLHEWEPSTRESVMIVNHILK